MTTAAVPPRVLKFVKGAGLARQPGLHRRPISQAFARGEIDSLPTP